MPAALYQYDTLPPGKWFRLLQIEPGQYDDPLHCTLITTAIDNAPAYIALSYAWGDPADIGHVTCSGIKRPVTRSLLGGLRQLRHTETREMVWADAICINQADFKEKGGQVNLMGTIYDQAAEVFVWLGDDPKLLARHAFEALPGVNKAVTAGTHRTWYKSELTFDVGDGVKRPGMVSRDNTASMLNERNLEAIKQMYQRPWFTRVWVLQEVGLATKATACWGDCRIDFCEIAVFVWFAIHDYDLEKRVRPDLKAVISGCPYYAVYSVWSTYRKKDSWIEASTPLKVWADHLADQTNIDFILVLEASRTFNATDARDHVFAFLGHPCALLPGTKDLLVEADYELSLEDLYHSVAQALSKVVTTWLMSHDILL
ncbi:HET-domain-containing protein [Lizonia empirigonia]|nr:HET-domain-containing protein [Lizonia empirigonia]